MGVKRELEGIGTDFLSGVRSGFNGSSILGRAFNSQYGAEPPREWKGKYFKLTKKGDSVLAGEGEARRGSYLWYLDSIWAFGDVSYKENQEVDLYFSKSVKKSEEASRVAILRGLIKLRLLKIVDK